MMALNDLVPENYCCSWRFGFAMASLCAGLSVVGCGSNTPNLLPVVPPATAASSNVPSGPILGYVFTASDGTLRAVLGVRGSARVSASIVPAGVYVAGDASTASSAGLLEDEAGSLFAFNLPQSQPIHVADGLISRVQIAFSASGETAIAYGAGSSSVTLVTGLPGSPVAQKIPVPSAAQVVSGVVSDKGTVVLVMQGASVAVGTLSANGGFSKFASPSAVPGLNFLPGADDLLIADGGANAVSLIRNVSSSPASQVLTVAGLNKPVAIAASKDRKWAGVVNGGDSNILRVDLASGTAVSKVVCDCKATQLSSLAGNGLFRVNPLGTGPLWTVDLAGVTPELLFVPAIGKTTP